VPFRDSVLTRILADSLTGNSLTTIVTTVRGPEGCRMNSEPPLRAGALTERAPAGLAGALERRGVQVHARLRRDGAADQDEARDQRLERFRAHRRAGGGGAPWDVGRVGRVP
jgi:hypothetical protein